MAYTSYSLPNCSFAACASPVSLGLQLHKSGFTPPSPRCSARETRLRVSCFEERKIEEPASIQDEFQNKRIYRVEASKWRKGPPLVNALKAAAEENVASFIFPGHDRGLAAPSAMTDLIGDKPFLHDLGALDNLFDPEGPILEAQKQASEVFGASETWFFVGGSTSAIQAAIMSTCRPGDTLILPRNAHVSAISAMVFSGAVPKYLFPSYDMEWDIATAVSPSKVEKAIRELELEGTKPAAVFVTSPNYNGICSNVKEIAYLCHSQGIPLIVDEAHGAHFGFHSELPISALQQGADVVVQSTHKVLFSLTQSSMLHLSGNLVDRENICKCFQTLQSTSPSFLLLASLDATTAQLKENPAAQFDNAIRLAVAAKQKMKHIEGISVLDFPTSYESPAIDPLRLTVGFSDLSLSGYEADDFLFRKQKIITEVPLSRSIIFPFSPGTSAKHVDRLILGLKQLSAYFLHQRKKQRSKHAHLIHSTDIDMQLTPREAFFAKKRKVDISYVVGKISGELICPYPPGIPVMIPGEVITEKVLHTLLQAKADGATLVGASDPLLSSLKICDL